MKGKMLVVDDEDMIRELLCSALSREGYTCFSAGDSDAALRIITEHDIDLTFLDIMMPGCSGMDLLPEMKNIKPDTSVVMITALCDLTTAMSCIQMGADDYIVKPFNIDRIIITAQNSIEKRRLSLENREYHANLESKVQEQTRQINLAMKNLNLAYDDTLSALVKALDAREKETGSHSERVMNYTQLLAQRCGVAGPELSLIAKGTLLHDIGKIGVSDRILLKEDKLDAAEWLDMKKHPQVGYEILSGIKFLDHAAQFVLAHHERYDGSGYPFGLKKDEIPLSARIFAFADTLDAMTSNRPYRKALPFKAVTDEVKACSTSQFDPEIAEIFLAIPQKTWEEAGGKSLL